MNGSTREPRATAGEQAEARGQIYDLLAKVGNLEGQVKHLASKAEIEKAKNWLIVTIAAAVISILALAANLARLFVR